MRSTINKIIIYQIFSILVIKAQATDDFIRVAFELGCFSYSQFKYHNHVTEHKSSAPNNLDSFVRNKLLWNQKNRINAKKYSDFLLYGVVLGSLPIIPKTTNEDYKKYLLIQLEILSINGLITNFTKNTFDRQRPYSYYGINKNDKDSFKSFYSGHTSTSFALAISSAKILSEYTELNKKFIWCGTLGIASATGYFRIAADKHYFTDIIAGAVIGSLIGHFTYQKLHNKYFSRPQSNTFSIWKNLGYTNNKIKIIIPI